VIEELRKLRALRLDVVSLKAEIAEREKELATTQAGQALAKAKSKCAALKEDVFIVETKIKEAAVEAYLDEDNKRPWPGVNIKMFKVLLCESTEVEDWCREFAPCLLIVDQGAYRKAFDTLPGAPGKMVVEPRAQIDRDLSKAAGCWSLE